MWFKLNYISKWGLWWVKLLCYILDFCKTHLFYFYLYFIFILPFFRLLESLDLKHRMDGELFISTILLIRDFEEAYFEYQDYAMRLTSLIDGTEYKLIEQSLRDFVNLMYDDMQSVFG